MKALVTGASGFVGQHLTALLKREGIETQGIGYERRDMAGYQALDLADAAAAGSLNLLDYDWVLHLAGLAAVGPSFDQPRRYIDVNAGMQINLLEACLHQSARPRTLIVSSGAIYGAGALPLDETSDLEPTSPYSISKITQEQLGRYYGRRGLEIIIARPFNHIGPGQGEGFILPDLAKQVAARTSPIRTGNLASKRDYTDVRDIVEAYVGLLRLGHANEVYNVCSGQSVSGKRLLEGLQEIAGTSLKIEPDSSRLRPAEIADIYGDHTKIARTIGWKPKIQLEQTLRDVFDDWRQRLTVG